MGGLHFLQFQLTTCIEGSLPFSLSHHSVSSSVSRLAHPWCTSLILPPLHVTLNGPYHSDPNVLPILLGSVKYEVYVQHHFTFSLLLTYSSCYSKETADGLVSFFNEYRARSNPTGALPLIHVLDNHNHLRSVLCYPSCTALLLTVILTARIYSNILSIGTEDEAQAKVILEFVRTCIAKVVARASGSGDFVKY